MVCEAQICYLLSNPKDRGLGPVDSPTTAIALLGADHTNIEKFRVLLEPSVFMLSEIFEFAIRRTGKAEAMPALQPFKYAFACLLADFGFIEKAEKYLEFLAAFVRALPASSFSTSFRSNLKDFEKRILGLRNVEEKVVEEKISRFIRLFDF